MAHTDDSQIKAVDRELEARASGAMRELMEHRWHWTLDESNPGRKSMREYGRLIGRDHKTILKSARGFEMLRNGDESSPQDAYTLAGLSDDRQTVVQAVANADGITMASAAVDRRPEIKAIAERIAELPAGDKVQMARELADDREYLANVLRVQNERIEASREKSARKKASDRVGQKFDERIALHGLQAETSKYIKKAQTLIPEIGIIPDAEKFWLKGEADGLEDIAAELRHMAEHGETRQETELQNIVETG